MREDRSHGAYCERCHRVYQRQRARDARAKAFGADVPTLADWRKALKLDDEAIWTAMERT